MSNISSGDIPVPSPKTDFVGRDDIMEKIDEAISASSSHVFYLEGEGGTGKTRIVEEVVSNYRQKPHNSTHSYLCTDVIDLYSTYHHSALGIQKTIAHSLDHLLSTKPFEEFQVAYNDFINQRNRVKTEIGERLVNLRNSAHLAFARDYTRLAQEFRIILCLDTAEQMQYQPFQYAHLLELDRTDGFRSVRDWLVSSIFTFDNTVTILAGRPNSALDADLRDASVAQ